jgi:hypothetical protein
MPDHGPWRPTTFLRFEQALDTSMGTARIVTDAGPAYIKALGNRQGPHPLACEWVGTNLARWFGLPTFEFALLRIDASVDEIPFLRGGTAASGPAFVTLAASGHTWGGSAEELASLVNPEAVAHLVVFDTWTRNCDRYPADLTTRKPNYDNVFLEDVADAQDGSSRLVAMDHTHCFTCGRDLDETVAHIEKVKDERLYGLFPAFAGLVQRKDVEAGLGRLRQLEEQTVAEFVESIPAEWQVSAVARQALLEMIYRRAGFVAESMLAALETACWPV